MFDSKCKDSLTHFMQPDDVKSCYDYVMSFLRNNVPREFNKTLEILMNTFNKYFLFYYSQQATNGTRYYGKPTPIDTIFKSAFSEVLNSGFGKPLLLTESLKSYIDDVDIEFVDEFSSDEFSLERMRDVAKFDCALCESLYLIARAFDRMFTMKGGNNELNYNGLFSEIDLYSAESMMKYQMYDTLLGNKDGLNYCLLKTTIKKSDSDIKYSVMRNLVTGKEKRTSSYYVSDDLKLRESINQHLLKNNINGFA